MGTFQRAIAPKSLAFIRKFMTIQFFSLLRWTGFGLALLMPLTAPALAIPTTPAATVQIAQVAPTNPHLRLTLADLPAGFTAPPPAVAAQIAQQIAPLSGQMQANGINPEDIFVFLHPTALQIVVGFHATVADQGQFDAYLKQSQQPEYQEAIATRIQERLAQMENIALNEYTSLPNMKEVGDESAGLQLELELYETNFKADLITFRQGNIGMFTAVMYPAEATPLRPLLDLANILNDRI
ncbi:MAG: hypothetical protein EA366_15575 [Spirulina sp. DLM2.Bin59]|nr:MAG: hypothetical protein EA366_15575 [Spirulina sp. DLM2.Bin59]